LFTQPDDPTDSAWLRNDLEYQFSVPGQSVANRPQTVLAADQYPGGHLDWFSFDSVIDQKVTLPEEAAAVEHPEKVESFLPGPVPFKVSPSRGLERWKKSLYFKGGPFANLNFHSSWCTEGA
jgi:hypothetical protein